ncbi:portal vertex protein [Pantoea phage Phynn]|nr:portal vertex protein [Pantoea phage Phynn]
MNGLDRFLDFFRNFGEKDEKDLEDQLKNDAGSIAPPKNNDGAVEVETDLSNSKYSSMFQQFYGGQDPRIQNKTQLVNTYRGLMSYPEVDNAVSEIIDDAIVNETDKDIVSLDLSKTDFSEAIQKKIVETFQEVLNVHDFDNKANRLFRDWYVDSRIYFHKIMHKEENKGIRELRQLDPRNMELIRESFVETVDGQKVFRGYREFFLYTAPASGYSYNGLTFGANEKVKIPRSAIVYAHSGEEDVNGNIIGYLHRAIKPANQLRLLEDAMVIYRITRAPERRVFYIDVGQMGGAKATQYVNNIAQGLKNRVVYNASTGTINNQQNNMSMTEDYWLMRRDGKAVTEVSTLPGGSNFSDMDDTKWFNRKLHEALRVPLSRMPRDDGGMQIGGGGDITRDELKFSKFIRTLQVLFSPVLSDPLKTNLIAKKIITEEDWENNASRISFIFQQDSYYAELKDIEILERRLNLMSQTENVVGKYVSHKYIMKEILRMSDEDIEREAKEIEAESQVERFKNPEETEENF